MQHAENVNDTNTEHAALHRIASHRVAPHPNAHRTSAQSAGHTHAIGRTQRREGRRPLTWGVLNFVFVENVISVSSEACYHFLLFLCTPTDTHTHSRRVSDHAPRSIRSTVCTDPLFRRL